MDNEPEDFDPIPRAGPADTCALRQLQADHERTKLCRECRQTKSGWAFTHDTREPDRLATICRACRSIAGRAWYVRNRERRLAQQRAARRARKQEAERARRAFLESLSPDACPLIRGE